jgi:8-oxo-dGTP pyrophosphatase MutT (NUDIX family)
LSPDLESLARRITPELVVAALAAETPLPYAHVDVDPTAFAAAAVVVPIRFAPAPVAFVVVRARDLADHAGELGFPGGKPLSPEETLADAAFRELGEELALGPSDVSELGRLRAVPVITGKYLITPFVAAVRAGATPRLASRELDLVIPVQLAPLIAGTAARQAVRSEWRGSPFPMPHFRFGDRVLYGASALIFFELLLRVAEALGTRLPDPVLEESYPWGDRY